MSIKKTTPMLYASTPWSTEQTTNKLVVTGRGYITSIGNLGVNRILTIEVDGKIVNTISFYPESFPVMYRFNTGFKLKCNDPTIELNVNYILD